MKLKICALSAIAISLFIQLKQSEAATFAGFQTANGQALIRISGKLEPNDPQRLIQQMHSAQARKIPIWGVMLNSPGGNAGAGLQLAKIVRDNKLSSFVEPNASCMSACFFVFAAGVYRYADASAKVGVHSASNIEGKETELTKSVTVDFSRVLKSLDVPDHIIGKIVITPSSDITILSSDDLKSMNVQFVPSDDTYIRKLASLLSPTTRIASTAGPEAKRHSRMLNAEAIELISQNQYARAKMRLIDAATENPFDSEILGNLGYAMHLSGEYTLAQGTLLMALRLQPQRSVTWQNLGMATAELGQLDYAAEYLRRCFIYSKDPSRTIQQLENWSTGHTGSPNLARAASVALSTIRAGT